jgi:hypothetical protein
MYLLNVQALQIFFALNKVLHIFCTNRYLYLFYLSHEIYILYMISQITKIRKINPYLNKKPVKNTHFNSLTVAKKSSGCTQINI